MHVDRKRFLLLSAAIAGGACGATPAPNQGAATPPATQEPPEPAPPEPAPPDTPDEPETPVVEVATPEPSSGPDSAADHSAQCDGLTAPGPTCESFAQTKKSCHAYATTLTLEAAAQAVNCLTQKSGTRKICVFGIDATCALEGTKAAPQDSNATSDCRAVAQKCGHRSRWSSAATQRCVSALSGYQPRVQSRLLSCISEFCEVRNCFYQVH